MVRLDMGNLVLLAFPELLLLPSPDVSAARSQIPQSAEVKLSISLIFLYMAILSPIFRLAVWKRKNLARWTLFILFMLFLPSIFFSPHMFRPDHLPLTIYIFAGTLLEAVGFYLLFTGDAQPWFRP